MAFCGQDHANDSAESNTAVRYRDEPDGELTWQTFSAPYESYLALLQGLDTDQRRNGETIRYGASLQGLEDRYALPSTSRHTETSEEYSPTDVVAGPSPSDESHAICRWDGCGKEVLGGVSTAAVLKHFKREHTQCMEAGRCWQCGWPECETVLKPTSIAKHVANSHFNAARRLCPLCLKSYATKDSFDRHEPRCKGRVAEGL